MTEASTGTSNTDLFRFCPRLVPLSLASVFGLYALLVNFMCGNLRSCFKPKYVMMNVKPHTFLLALSDSAALDNSCHLFVISGMSSTGGCCMFIPVTFAIQSR